MAIAAFMAPVSGVRGKIGGQIFSANRSGPYIRAWSKGSNPRSTRQTVHRAVLITFAQAWSAITGAQQADWDTYAALTAQEKTNSLGETYFASGFAWFVQLNIAREQNGQAQLSDAPVLSLPSTPIIETVTFRASTSPTNSAIKITAGSPDLGEQHIVHAEIKNSLGRTAQASIRPYMITAEPSVGGRFLIFQDELETTFGDTLSGQRLFVRVQVQNTEGRQGAAATGTADAP